MEKVREHVRGNVVGYVALFVALSGTAWAASELSKGEVRSKHIRNAGVKAKDLANDAVTSPKVADASLQAEDFAPDELPAGSRGPQGPPGERGLPGETGAPGEPGRDGILDAVGRSTASPEGRCIPGATDLDPDPLECVATTLTTTRTARLLLDANADWGVYGGPPYAGECRFSLNGAPVPGGPVTHPGEDDLLRSMAVPTHDHLDHTTTGDVDKLAQLGLTHVTEPLPAGTYRAGLVCDDTQGNILFKNESISAVAISPN